MRNKLTQLVITVHKSRPLPATRICLTRAFLHSPSGSCTNRDLLGGNCFLSLSMRLYGEFKEILKIQKFRRLVSYTGFYCFATLISYAYVSNTTRAGYSRADQFYASYPAGTELLTDTTKLYKAALGNCFEAEEWGPFEFCIMAKHFERQGKSPYAYHAQYMAHLLSEGQLDGSG
ncbi:hypothetical protein VNO77_15211 [Canavalia gladiata]|uniref:Uncharacterized protein n=1 Tax=Canavalia gladiata TaxID=3824 RepID=A0AAN9LZC1_CANGL